MGGLINSSTVKGDLWMIEAGGNMACYPLATTAEGPGPRVGHSSLLVGNAFIVYGGDTKIDESDILDETLYLLNTCKSFLRCTCRRLADTHKQLQDNGRELSHPVHARQVDTGTLSTLSAPRFSFSVVRSKITS